MKKVTVKVPTDIQSIADRTQRVLQMMVDTAGQQNLTKLVDRAERDGESLRNVFRQIIRML